MAFSDTVAQQREKQAKALKRFIMASFTGSLALHGGGLFLKASDLWKPNEPVSEEITIVAEDEPEIPIEPVEESGGSGSGSGFAASEPSVQFSEPVAVEQPAPASAIEPPVEELPPEEPPPEEPIPAPLTEDVLPEPARAEQEPTETAEESPPQPPEPLETAANPPANSRSLSDLLSEIRRARQQASESATATGPLGSGNGIGAGSGNGTRSGFGTGTGSGSGDGSGNGSGNGSGDGSGNGSTTAAAPTRPEPITPPANQGSRSREVSCRGCDFDYPDEADGAEGTAQVIVETDNEGRVVSVTLSRSSGNAALDQAALEQARRRVRLNNARAGESYPIDVDFVQPNSEAARRTQERGDRRSITVSDPEPTIETPAPTAITNPSPEPTGSGEPSPTPNPSVSPEPSISPDAELRPSGTDNAEPLDSNPVSEPSAEPDLPPEALSPSEPVDSVPPTSEPEPIPVTEPAPEPEPIPAPEPVSEPEPVLPSLRWAE